MTGGRAKIFCIGVNHNSADLSFREKLYLSPAKIEGMVPSLQGQHDLKELIVMSTCNRLELYGVSYEGLAEEHCVAMFSTLQQANAELQLTRQEIEAHSYTFYDGEAVGHLYRVASGIDSLILGETQITGQFKNAAVLSRRLKVLGPVLNRLSQEALATAKKVRSQTDIGKKPVSISHAAIELANRVYGEIRNHDVLIIGAGEMAEIAAKYVLKYNPKSLTIANRTLSKAEKLVDELAFGTAIPLDMIPDALVRADIVIASTGSQHPILSKEGLEKSQLQRNNKPVFLIDIALPRNIEPSCGDLDDVYLFDIDDLKQVVDKNVRNRQQEALKARDIIEQSARLFLVWLESATLRPKLEGFKDYLDELIARETEKTFKSAKLSHEQQEKVQLLLQSIANKMTSDASISVKKPPEGFYSEDLAEALSVLFPSNKEEPSE